MKTRFLENEYWYGGAVYEGYRQPAGEDSDITWDFRENPTNNQIMPLFVSSKGRYIWSESGFQISFQKGKIQVEGSDSIILEEGYGTLKGAYRAAMQKYFPFHEIHLSDMFFRRPVYNSWIELTYYQTQENILKYAEEILNHGFPPGVLMIDDGWSPYYGRWKFRGDNFQDAKWMIKKLHDMGFLVMLWICPFITPDTLEFRETRDKHYLIETPEGKARILEWWNGYSAAVDLTNPEAMQWLKNQMDELMDMGIDGFKFDAGDSCYYTAGDKTFREASNDELSRLWAQFAEQYSLNEIRVCFKAGGYSLMQRLCDKRTVWDETGIAGLIPDTLIQGITGHPFGSPDMIGGGEYTCFLEGNDVACTPEMFVRYAQIAALMPVMQFSASPWRVLSNEKLQEVREAMALREKYLPQILDAFEKAKCFGEPIVRSMEYVFPGEKLERVMDQFMVGDSVLVAPVYEQGESSRVVRLPKGRWKTVSLDKNDEDVMILDGGMEVVLGYNHGLIILERQI